MQNGLSKYVGSAIFAKFKHQINKVHSIIRQRGCEWVLFIATNWPKRTNSQLRIYFNFNFFSRSDC